MLPIIAIGSEKGTVGMTLWSMDAVSVWCCGLSSVVGTSGFIQRTLLTKLLAPEIVRYSHPLFNLPWRMLRPEGGHILLSRSELASMEMSVDSLVHSRNGWPVGVAKIYTALAWRFQVFGPGHRANDSNAQAVKEDKLNLKGRKDDVFKAGT